MHLIGTRFALALAVVTCASAVAAEARTSSAGGGQDAVACQYSMLQSVQVATKVCKLSRLKVDDAIDAEVANLEKYMSINFPGNPSPAQFAAGKRRMQEDAARNPSLKRALCQSKVLVDIRQRTPAQIHQMVKSQLANPAARPQACF